MLPEGFKAEGGEIEKQHVLLIWVDLATVGLDRIVQRTNKPMNEVGDLEQMAELTEEFVGTWMQAVCDANASCRKWTPNFKQAPLWVP